METQKQHLGIPRTLIPWYPITDEERCTGCMSCVTACELNVFAMDTDKPCGKSVRMRCLLPEL